jgi:hypothetical protein
LGSIATSLAASLRDQVRSAVVIGGPIRTDATALRSAELTGKISSLVAGSLGLAVKALGPPMSLDAAREAAQSHEAIVYLDIEIAQGKLRVSADLYPIPHNMWDRCRNPKPDPIAHAAAQVPIDAEIRAYLSPVPLVASRPLKVSNADPETIALICDDFDQDGSLELLLLGRRQISTGRIRNNAYEVLQKSTWDSISPIAPVPLRQPLASAVVHGPGQIDIGITDRAKSVRLNPLLQVQSYFEGIPVALPEGSACSKLGPSMLLSERLSACVLSDSTNFVRESSALFDASAAARMIDPAGSIRDVWAIRYPAEGRLTLRDQAGATASVKDVGAQIALADIDLDGDPEIIASRDVLDERDDALIVRTWKRDGSTQQRYSVPVTSGVNAIAVCPPENNGLRTIVLATKGELWLLR